MACWTAAFASGLTCGEPLTTRDTVPRPTPARAATSSSVGRPADRLRWVGISSRGSAPTDPLQRTVAQPPGVSAPAWAGCLGEWGTVYTGLSDVHPADVIGLHHACQRQHGAG